MTMCRATAVLLLCSVACAHAGVLADKQAALASVLMDGQGPAACEPGDSKCSAKDPSLSLLQNHAAGLAARSGGAAGATAAMSTESTLQDRASGATVVGAGAAGAASAAAAISADLASAPGQGNSTASADAAPQSKESPSLLLQEGSATNAVAAAASKESGHDALGGQRGNSTSGASVVLRSQDASSVAGSSTSTDDSKLSVATATINVFIALGLLLFAGLVAMSKEPSRDEEPGLPKYVAEFVGTFMLVLSVGCNVLVGDATWGVVSIACTLMVAIYALGGVSGANFNPCVSLALCLSGKLPKLEALIYVCVQLAAGVCAGLVYGCMLGATFNLAPSSGFKGWQAGLGELLYTAMLCFVVLNTAASKRHAGKDQFYGLAIGFSVVAGGYGAGSISGGCFNPAIALGIDTSSMGVGFGWCLAYFAFEALGACLAAGLFRVCRPDDFDETLEEKDYSVGSCLVSEFLGTYMLVLTVGLNVLAGSKAAVFSIAASLMCMIFALGSVSGAHFNPAVTTAILCSGRGLLTAPKATAYVGAQLCGGLLAALTASLLEGGRTVPLGPGSSSTELQALIGEFAFTFLLSFVVLSVATTKKAVTQYFGLAIGSCVTAGGLAIGSLSGGSLNPAVSAGLALSDLTNAGTAAHLPGYVVAEIFAGVAAAGTFRLTHAAEFAKA